MGARRYRRRTYVWEAILILGALVFCLPVYLLIVMALKSGGEVYTHPLSIPTDPHLKNFSDAWAGTTQLTMGHAFVNSLVISISSVALLIVLGSLAAYAIARRASKLATWLYVLFVFGLILPFQLGIIPLYVAMRHVGLIGTRLGMILLFAGLLMPLTIFLYAGFIRALPKEYEEAAQVDGAGLFRTFFRVVFPLLMPITGTVAVLTGLFTWNEFFLPLIFLSGTPNQPIPVAIYGFVGEFASQWNLIFAAVGISIVPMLLFFIFAQKQLIRGFAGGIRG
jgi:raffinose/stachyose/melibiose transport system permease protein